MKAIVSFTKFIILALFFFFIAFLLTFPANGLNLHGVCWIGFVGGLAGVVTLFAKKKCLSK